MKFKNAMIYTEDFRFVPGGFEVQDGKFTDIFTEDVEDAVDLQGAYVIPGLIDVHTHGNSGEDFSDGSYDGLVKMAAHYARCGVTSFAPASMTLPYETLSKAFTTARAFVDAKVPGVAVLRGIQMEGPFFSEAKKGAQNGEYLRNPDIEAFRKLYDECGGLIRIADVAPELPGSDEFIHEASKLCTVSIAHTDADYYQAAQGILAGVTHLTHAFNAMAPVHHRKPGVIAAASEDERVSAELICDGLHVHPAVIRLTFRLFGAERMVLVSDSLRCCGMPNGEYELGGQPVFLKDGLARLTDGTIAGSAIDLYECMLRAISFGIAKEDAIRAATYNPARQIGALAEVGSIAKGKVADFIICDEDLCRKAVYLKGELLSAEA
ncbi:MAG: N-acetylglucosamine-6-phosphate deacetylase [Oscillospiraceae bacterium]|nr:N-acetylglucosamine-6-phosphate deacetylase [Oscillospiraceae bacterium]